MPIPDAIIPADRVPAPMDARAATVIEAVNRYLRALIDGAGQDEAGREWDEVCKEAKKC